MRNSTENMYQQKVNQVIDYISANLHTPRQLDVIADKIKVAIQGYKSCILISVSILNIQYVLEWHLKNT